MFTFAEFELSAVVFDNGFGQTQAQAGALANGLGRKERLHDASLEFGRYTGPAIDHGENNGLLLARAHLIDDLRSCRAHLRG
jgi:hypothetical protein